MIKTGRAVILRAKHYFICSRSIKQTEEPFHYASETLTLIVHAAGSYHWTVAELARWPGELGKLGGVAEVRIVDIADTADIVAGKIAVAEEPSAVHAPVQEAG